MSRFGIAKVSVALLLIWGSVVFAADSAPPVPTHETALYQNLNADLDAFEREVAAHA